MTTTTKPAYLNEPNAIGERPRLIKALTSRPSFSGWGPKIG